MSPKLETRYRAAIAKALPYVTCPSITAAAAEFLVSGTIESVIPIPSVEDPLTREAHAVRELAFVLQDLQGTFYLEAKGLKTPWLYDLERALNAILRNKPHD